MASVEKLLNMMEVAGKDNQSIYIGYFINDTSMTVKIIPDVMETDGCISIYDKNGQCAFNLSFVCDEIDYDEDENIFEIHPVGNTGMITIVF